MIGRTLGHYRITEKRGEGGMGVVYRAQDTRLDRSVAVKVLPAEFASDPERLRRFEHEAKAVAALNHPNILTVHDVGTEEGTPYVVMELLEGENFREVLSRRAPTLRQVLSFAVQIARGLSAAHRKGIVHRDLKPENLFVTTDGRVKILDFGLAKLMARAEASAQGITETSPTQSGLVMGTVPYMSPEQVRGLPLDHRSDIFSLGVVLYELLTRRHPFRRETVTATLTAIIEDSPAELSHVDRAIPPAVSGIVRRCLEKSREDRFQGVQDLASALEALVGAPAGAAVLEEVEERSPYPGLSSFTEKDAGNFFGREEEVKALWQRLRNRRLLAVIGPSGAGKTSFVRAGVIPGAPEGWRCLWVTPGNRPFAAVARALVPQLSNDPEVLQRLVGAETGEELSSVLGIWRRRHDEALLVVDQFEELFTLNPVEVQERFSSFLGQLVSDADVHVLISLRDDFLMRCQEHPTLTAVFTELTPLGALTKESLRRALEEPAKKLGYRFEDESLIDEMVESVEGARAALPLLAFAVSRLWEKRDREKKLLTRAAYEEIGGVAGALAQHAEAVMDRIGVGQDIVREIFRNLVTAQGTRAVVDRDELLSAFPEKGVAEGVLRELIDARLVTSYELEGREGEASHHRVEVVHESLLKAWPRLVWWQAQDEEGAVLRDQLKQAAHLWDERGRPADLLWSGASFRAYELWRERYPGALTTLEENFARSMAEQMQRQRRRRRLAVCAVIAAALLVALVTAVLWRKSEISREQAVAEAGRHEAAKVLALGRLRLVDHPNAALAYAIASLERSDNAAARRLAVEALWQGPPALYLRHDPVVPTSLVWSPDQRWLAVGGEGLLVLSREGGERRQLSSSRERPIGFTSDVRWLLTSPEGMETERLHVWALPEGRLERTVKLAGRSYPLLVNDEVVTCESDTTAAEGEQAPMLLRRLSLDGKSRQILGRLPDVVFDIDPSGTWIVSAQRGRIVQQRLDTLSAPARVLGSYEGNDIGIWMRPWSERVVTGNDNGDVRIWNVPLARLERTLKSPAGTQIIELDPKERFLAACPGRYLPPRSLFLFDLAAPRSAEPVLLLSSGEQYLNSAQFSPDGSWLATNTLGDVILWNMTAARSIVLGRHAPPWITLAFTPNGDLLSTSNSREGILRRWPLSPAAGEGVQSLLSRPGVLRGMVLEVDPNGRFAVLLHSPRDRFFVVPLDGSKPVIHQITSREGDWASASHRVDPSGKFVAVQVGSLIHPEENSTRIVDLSTGNMRTLDTRPKGEGRCYEVGSDREGFALPLWLPDGRLLSDGEGGLRIWDLATGTSRLLRPCKRETGEGFWLLASPDSRLVLRLDPASQTESISSISVFDLASRATREVTTHGNKTVSFAINPRGTALVTGDKDGIVRVGPLTGEEPHLLFGHTGPVMSVAVSPDGRWIASGSDDGTIRLWPMPDLSKPPLHTLPHDELAAKLKSLTNLRAVRDPSSDTGWKIDIGPFPGWTDVPTW